MQFPSITRPKQVAFDESGNTGQDLLSREQPVFVLASVRVDDDVAQRILAKALAGDRREAKAARLMRSGAGRRRLLHAFEDEGISPTHVKLMAYHKRFLVTTKIVDQLLETMMHENGFDLYENAGNLALANLLHLVTPAFCGQAEHDELLRRFVSLARDVNDESIRQFYSQVDRLLATCTDREFIDVLQMLRATQSVVREAIVAPDKTAIDPAIPAFVDLAAQWSFTLGEPFEIVHDESKPLQQFHEVLASLMSLSKPGREYVSPGPTWRLPILSTGITFVSSADVPAVQLADLLAGVMCSVLSDSTRGPVGQFARDILSTRFGQLKYSPVWPSTAVTPSELRADLRQYAQPALEHSIALIKEGRRE